jgi:hypothetical protein
MAEATRGGDGRGVDRGAGPGRRLGALLGSAGAVALLRATGFIGAVDRPARAETSPREQVLAELGRRLFFDPVVSRSGERACASCHAPDHGFSDPSRVSEDDVGLTVRHSQTLIDGHLNPSAHWDGEFESVEALVNARVGSRPANAATGPPPRTSRRGTAACRSPPSRSWVATSSGA